MPHHLAGLEILANPGAAVIGPAVEVTIHKHHTAVLVLHVLVGVDLFLLDSVHTVRAQLQQVAARAVACRRIDETAVDDGGGNDGNAISRLEKMQKELAVRSRHPGHAFHSNLDVLAYTTDLVNHDR